jgi:uncharacterized protein (DUF433 family)
MKLLEIGEGFENWEKCLVSDPDIMGGETVFPGLRLTVRHIRGMLERGELPSIILEDYPYLSQEDIKFAPIYTKNG